MEQRRFPFPQCEPDGLDVGGDTAPGVGVVPSVVEHEPCLGGAVGLEAVAG